MKTTKSNSTLLVALFPLAIILLGYNFLFHWPMQRELRASSAKLENLESRRVDKIDLVSNEELLKRLRREQSETSVAIGDQRQQLQTFSPTALRSVDETGIVNRLTELFRKHGLQMQDHEIVSESLPPGITKLDQVLQQHGLASGAPGSSNTQGSRRRSRPNPSANPNNGNSSNSTISRTLCRFTLRGTYGDFLSGMEDLAKTSPQTVPIRLEMEPIKFNEVERVWILVVLIG